MGSKPTGLAAFARNRETDEQRDTTRPTRRKAQGATVALTVRIPRPEWERLHALAVSEGVSIQSLAVSGLSRVFQEHGLPPITS